MGLSLDFVFYVMKVIVKVLKIENQTVFAISNNVKGHLLRLKTVLLITVLMPAMRIDK